MILSAAFSVIFKCVSALHLMFYICASCLKVMLKLDPSMLKRSPARLLSTEHTSANNTCIISQVGKDCTTKLRQKRVINMQNHQMNSRGKNNIMKYKPQQDKKLYRLLRTVPTRWFSLIYNNKAVTCRGVSKPKQLNSVSSVYSGDSNVQHVFFQSTKQKKTNSSSVTDQTKK